MKTLLEKSLYLALMAVLALLAASVAAFLIGVIEVVNVLIKFISAPTESSGLVIYFIQVMDTFLIATALLIFAVALYELFVGDLELPNWLVIHSFDGLKTKLSGVVILVLAVTFTKNLVEWQSATDTLFFGLAIAVVVMALVVYNRTTKSTDKSNGKEEEA
jgi:uncharacterized membrane protein YqhA